MKLSNMEQKSVKQEGMQQLSCAGNLEKALPYQPLLPPFLVLTAQDFRAQIGLCSFMDPVLHHKVDQMVLLDYDGQRRRKLT